MIAGAALAQAQTLQVQLAPEQVYAGDAFRLIVAVDGTRLGAVDYEFQPAVQQAGQSTSLSSINGAISSSCTLRLIAPEPGTYQLRRLTATTQEGKTLTYDQPLQVTVRELAADPDLTLAFAADPAEPLPGDEVTLTLTITAPGWRDPQGRLHSPFLERDFFGRVQERLPQVTFDFHPTDDAVLKLLEQPRAVAPTHSGETLTWKVTARYRALRPGTYHFSAPILRDTRILSVDARGSAREEQCASIGKPLTLQVAAPPMEGRPERYVGAIGHTFTATAALNTLGAKVGDPLQLTLQLQGDGDPSLLRAPTLPPIDGFRLYGESTRESLSDGARFIYTLRPLRAGLLEIPPLALGWFERSTRAYRTVLTEAVPLRVHPSAQLVLLGDDGEQVATALPPALRLPDSPELPPSLPLWSKALGALGVGALLLRALITGGRWLAAKVLMLLQARRPLAKACAILARTTRPDEATAAVRLWAKSPALTPAELRARLPESPDAAEAVRAYAELERAAYTTGADVPEARATLRRLLPLLRLLGVVLFFAASPLVAADSFVREQAQTLSITANTPEDYARAANLWLRLAREGSPSRAILLNGASCAFFARHPEIARTLIEAYELRYGRDHDSTQALRAACERLDRPMPGLLRRLAPHELAAWAVAALGIWALLCAIPWRRLRPLRWVLAAVTVGLAAGWGVLLVQSRSMLLPEALPEATEESQTEVGP